MSKHGVPTHPSRHPFAVAALICLFGLFSGPGRAVAQNQSPSETVRAATDAILTGIKQRRSEFQKSDAALEAFVRQELLPHIDRDYTARLVLGIHGRKASKEQVEAFAEALTDNLMRRYGRALLEVEAGTKIRVTGETPLRDGRMMRVGTEVSRSAGAPIPVDYMMRPGPDGKWLAFDVIVEGVSYVQTYRAQFDQPIRQRGLDQVITDLRADRIELDEG